MKKLQPCDFNGRPNLKVADILLFTAADTKVLIIIMGIVQENFKVLLGTTWKS